MKKLIAGASLFALLAGAPALAAGSAEDFIKDAAQGNMAEMAMGRMAETKAQSADVKQFAQKLVTDHGKAQDQLGQVAQKQNVTLPKELADKHRQDAQRLEKMQGAEFDRAFMAHMVQDHQKDVQKYQQAQKDIKDQQVTAYITATLPVLQQHLTMAQKLHRPEAAAAGSSSSGSGSSSQGSGGQTR
jgi:putative membrane protein